MDIFLDYPCGPKGITRGLISERGRRQGHRGRAVTNGSRDQRGQKVAGLEDAGRGNKSRIVCGIRCYKVRRRLQKLPALQTP